jgi:hypothetical protein
MRKWTESQALSTLSGVSVNGKIIILTKGLQGLKQCSALDYLRNHCGYRVNA